MSDTKNIPKGPLAEQLIQEMQKHKNNKIFNLSAWKEGIALSEELDAARKRRDSLDYDPLHRVYTEEQNKLSVFAELISTLPFISPLNEIIEKGEDIYMPSYPPMSPITTSTFAYWSLFDVTVGNDRESYSSLIIHLLSECDAIEPTCLTLLENMFDSRLGLYKYEGRDDKFVYLKELGTNQSFKVYSTSGYLGMSGEIWLARVLPSDPWGLTDYQVVVTTPYTIVDFPRNSFPLKQNDLFYDIRIWTDYIERSVGQLDTASGYAKLMKYGMQNDPYYWLEYIFLGYVNHTDQKIILTGLPDQPHTLPHHPDSEFDPLQDNITPEPPNNRAFSESLSGIKSGTRSNQPQYKTKITKLVGPNKKEKFGRNAPCPCGSGKKYKKCCANSEGSVGLNKIVPIQNTQQEDERGGVLATTTQEYIMLIRLQYIIEDNQTLVNQLNSLQCVEWKHNQVGKQFIVNYCDEACEMTLKVAADKVPKSVYPVILAHGKIVNGKAMILDLRSYLRGIELVKFIERYIGKSTVKTSNVIIWNKIHRDDPETCKKIFQQDYDELFSSNIVEVVDGDIYMDKLEAHMKKHAKPSDSAEQKMALAEKFIQGNDKFREFEQLSLQCYEEEGIQWLKTALKMREAVAAKRFSGEKNYTMHQLVQEMVKNIAS